MRKMELSPQSIRRFRLKIFRWWRKHRRDLPWRHTRDPYRIMVSEVMLQQTQVARVIPKYLEFLERFPTVTDLAAAKTADVIRLWKGLGYNRRALYLKRAAETVAKQHKGRVPETEKELIQLPGMGIYTVRALMVFAYEQEVPIVDTNIRKIITHFFFADVPQTEKIITEAAVLLVPEGRSWEWHQALMDYGALEMASYRIARKRDKKPIPFRESDRFYRGRILDAVRIRALPETRLLSEVSSEYGKPVRDLSVIVEGLIRDGLLIRTHEDEIQLP